MEHHLKAIAQSYDRALAAVMDIVRYKPDLREAVRKAVSDIDYLRYKETMHSKQASK